MAGGNLRPNAWIWTIAALAGLAWGLIALVFASLGPAGYVPQFFHNYHAEHLAAFYVITILAAVGLPRARLHQIGFPLILMAVILAIVRLFIPRHQLADAEDLAADVAGIVAAIGPIIVGRYRQIITVNAAPEKP